MAQNGFLLIADITGYTMFLTRSELEHAQGILDALFKSIFAEIKAPIILSNLQGDAALAYHARRQRAAAPVSAGCDRAHLLQLRQYARRRCA